MTYKQKQEKTRQSAIDWQLEFVNKTMCYSELAEMQEHFSKLAKRYGLIKEFKENCII